MGTCSNIGLRSSDTAERKVWVTPPGKSQRPAEILDEREWNLKKGNHEYQLWPSEATGTAACPTVLPGEKRLRTIREHSQTYAEKHICGCHGVACGGQVRSITPQANTPVSSLLPFFCTPNPILVSAPRRTRNDAVSTSSSPRQEVRTWGLGTGSFTAQQAKSPEWNMGQGWCLVQGGSPKLKISQRWPGKTTCLRGTPG